MATDCSKLISPSKFHRTLNGIELVKAREAAGLKQEVFADMCEHSQPYQSQLESPGEHEVHIDLVKKILAALQTRI